jgi:hypothetical protein
MMLLQDSLNANSDRALEHSMDIYSCDAVSLAPGGASFPSPVPQIPSPASATFSHGCIPGPSGSATLGQHFAANSLDSIGQHDYLSLSMEEDPPEPDWQLYQGDSINNAINIDRDNTNAQPAGEQHQMDPDLLPQVKAQRVYELVTARAARPERTTPPWESPVPGHPRWVAGNHGAC